MTSENNPSFGVVDLGNNQGRTRPSESAPERSCTSVAQGPRRPKGHDRLMDKIGERADIAPPRPAICPLCGLTADNGILVRSELTATATYCDTAGHLFAVTWLEVA